MMRLLVNRKKRKITLQLKYVAYKKVAEHLLDQLLIFCNISSGDKFLCSRKTKSTEPNNSNRIN